MAFATIAQIRVYVNRIADENEYTDDNLTDALGSATNMAIVDLSYVATEEELEALGLSSKALNLLTIFKSVEYALINKLGYARKTDTVSDVQYWQKEYKDLLKKVIGGDVKLTDNTTDHSPKNYPVINAGNQKFFPQKGVRGFTPESDGSEEDTVDI